MPPDESLIERAQRRRREREGARDSGSGLESFGLVGRALRARGVDPAEIGGPRRQRAAPSTPREPAGPAPFPPPHAEDGTPPPGPFAGVGGAVELGVEPGAGAGVGVPEEAPDPLAPASVQARQEILRRISGGNVSPGGVELDYRPPAKGSPSYEAALDRELERLGLARGLTAGQAGDILGRLDVLEANQLRGAAPPGQEPAGAQDIFNAGADRVAARGPEWLDPADPENQRNARAWLKSRAEAEASNVEMARTPTDIGDIAAAPVNTLVRTAQGLAGVAGIETGRPFDLQEELGRVGPAERGVRQTRGALTEAFEGAAGIPGFILAAHGLGGGLVGAGVAGGSLEKSQGGSFAEGAARTAAFVGLAGVLGRGVEKAILTKAPWLREHPRILQGIAQGMGGPISGAAVHGGFTTPEQAAVDALAFGILGAIGAKKPPKPLTEAEVARIAEQARVAAEARTQAMFENIRRQVGEVGIKRSPLGPEVAADLGLVSPLRQRAPAEQPAQRELVRPGEQAEQAPRPPLEFDAPRVRLKPGGTTPPFLPEIPKVDPIAPPAERARQERAAAEVREARRRIIEGFEERVRFENDALRVAEEAEALAFRETVERSRPAPEAIPPTRSLSSEAGVLDIGAVGEAVTKPARTLAGAAAEVGSKARAVGGDLIEFVESQPGGRALAPVARRIVSEQKAIRGRLMEGVAGKALRAPHTREVSEPRWVQGQDYGRVPLVEAVEGRATPSNVKDQQAVRWIRALTHRRGQVAEEVGVRRLRFDPETETATPEAFRATRGRDGSTPFVRMQHTDFISRLEAGDRAFIEHAARDWSHATGKPVEVYRERFQKMSEALRGGESADSIIDRQGFEFFRTEKNIPHVTRYKGDVVPYIVVKPREYVRALVDRGSARLAQIKVVGQDIGNEKPTEALRARYIAEGGTAEGFDRVWRVLSGHAMTPAVIGDAGSRAAQVGRGVKALFGLAKEGLLTASAIVNIPEAINVANIVGPRRAAGVIGKAIVESVKDVVGRSALLTNLARMGAISRDIADLKIHPDRFFTDAARAGRQVAGRVFGHRLLNEWQEKLYAIAANENVQRWRSGGKGPSLAEVSRLRGAGYTAEQAQRMASGRGTEAEYREYIQRASSLAGGGNAHPAETSLLQNTRTWKWAVAFDSYAGAVFRDTFRKGSVMARDVMDLARPGATGTRAERAKRAVGSTREFLQTVTTRTVQNAAAHIILQAVAGMGSDGLQIDALLSDIKNNTGEFIKDSAIFGILAGPYGAVLRLGEDQIADTVFPHFVASEVLDFVNSEGRYRDRSVGERIERALERFVPALRVGAGPVAAVGLGGDVESRQFEVAWNAYWRWRFEFDPPPRLADEAKGSDADLNHPRERGRRIRARLRRMNEIMQEGGDPAEVAREWDAAMQEYRSAFPADRARAGIQASIRNRKLLEFASRGRSKDEADAALDHLRRSIGNDAFSILQAWDRLVDSVSQARSGEGAAARYDFRRGERARTLRDLKRSLERKDAGR